MRALSEIPTIYCCDRCGRMFWTMHEPCLIEHPASECCHCTDTPLEEEES